jgi:Tfp pilus assembly protein FimT
MLMVLSVASILLGLTAPSASRLVNRYQLTAARDFVASSMTTARATAVQRETNAYFVRTGNSISVLVDSGATTAVIVPRTPLDSTRGVALTANYDTLRFDMRGMARPPGTTGQQITLTRKAVRDSVCVSVGGMIRARGCLL